MSEMPEGGFQSLGQWPSDTYLCCPLWTKLGLTWLESYWASWSFNLNMLRALIMHCGFPNLDVPNTFVRNPHQQLPRIPTDNWQFFWQLPRLQRFKLSASWKTGSTIGQWWDLLILRSSQPRCSNFRSLQVLASWLILSHFCVLDMGQNCYSPNFIFLSLKSF